MNVFVTGGTGFVGQSLLQSLLAAEHQVTILTRRPHLAPTHPRLRVIAGDLSNPTILTQALQPAPDALIHLVGIIAESPGLSFEAVHADLTRQLLAVAAQHHIPRWIQMSALGTRPQAHSRYHQTKWLAEEAVRTSNLAWTIFRPSLIYGPGDGFINLFNRIARFSPILPLMGNPATQFQPVPVRCVANAMTRALPDPSTHGQTYDLCGPTPLTLREILQTLLQVTRRHRLLLPIPAPLAKLQATALEFLLTRLLRQPSPLTRDQLVMLNEDNTGNPNPARLKFNLDLPSLDQGLRQFLTINRFPR